MSRWGALLTAAVVLCGCGGDDEPVPARSEYGLEARSGVFNDGSGRLGLVVLATLRDSKGEGPQGEWQGTLSNAGRGQSVAVRYASQGPGSFALWWYSELEAGEGELLSLSLGPAATPTHDVALRGAGGLGLALPEPTLSADGTRLTWSPVPGAALYQCRVRGEGSAFETLESEPVCDLSALPPGSWSASVAALSVDPRTSAALKLRVPPLPPRLDVSEAHISFVTRGESAPPVRLLAAGGAYDDGVSERGLAVWLSLSAPDGAAVAEPWTVRVVGPGLPASAPLTFTYPARLPRMMVWSPEVRAAQGSYSLTATSASGLSVSAPFAVGLPTELPMPLGIEAQAGAQGSATATWGAVTGARSYLVSAFDATSGELVTSIWVAGTSASFPAGSFIAGPTYHVYVAASDVDMAGGTTPAQVSVADNVFDFASFTSR